MCAFAKLVWSFRSHLVSSRLAMRGIQLLVANKLNLYLCVLLRIVLHSTFSAKACSISWSTTTTCRIRSSTFGISPISWFAPFSVRHCSLPKNRILLQCLFKKWLIVSLCNQRSRKFAWKQTQLSRIRCQLFFFSKLLSRGVFAFVKLYLFHSRFSCFLFHFSKVEIRSCWIHALVYV